MIDCRQIYLALGDSMSIDLYTGVEGGGAVNQLYKSLCNGWELEDHTTDGTTMAEVPTQYRGDLITLTIGGNDLLLNKERYLAEGLACFAKAHLQLLKAIRVVNPESCLIVGNIYAPQFLLPPAMVTALDEANRMIAENACRVNAHLADIRTAFRGREHEYLCFDIEPNLQGATEIAKLFREAYRLAKKSV